MEHCSSVITELQCNSCSAFPNMYLSTLYITKRPVQDWNPPLSLLIVLSMKSKPFLVLSCSGRHIENNLVGLSLEREPLLSVSCSGGCIDNIPVGFNIIVCPLRADFEIIKKIHLKSYSTVALF